jgi:23S rRNA pseudouridine955/2504/2580 synthase
LRLAPDSKAAGRVKVDSRRGKDAETHFRVLQTRADAPAGPLALVEARPVTGRTHQIRVHLAEAGHPVVGDTLYGQPRKTAAAANPVIAGLPLALRAEALAYSDPFDQRRIRIEAPSAEFIRQYGFESA